MKKRARRNHTPAFKAKVALAGRKTIERLHSLLSSSTCIPDISYIPMARGFVYLTAVMDWFTRRILAWRLSNTMEASFCIMLSRKPYKTRLPRKSSTPIVRG